MKGDGPHRNWRRPFSRFGLVELTVVDRGGEHRPRWPGHCQYWASLTQLAIAYVYAGGNLHAVARATAVATLMPLHHSHSFPLMVERISLAVSSGFSAVAARFSNVSM